MEVIYNFARCKNESAVALGIFDGVHIGHKAVIEGAVKAKAQGYEALAFTFYPNPAEVLNKPFAGNLIDMEAKKKLIADLGIDKLYITDFRRMQNMPPEEFVGHVLVNLLNVRKIFCGYNYRFGKGGYADTAKLRRLCEPFHIDVVEIKPVIYGDNIVSSTLIREMLAQGEIEKANAMLGRYYSYNLEVEKGEQLGRTIEVPTINQALPSDFVMPKFGVYASAVWADGKWRCAVTNIGVKPTVGEHPPLSETWIPNYNTGELYGKKAEVRLFKFLRPEQKFDCIESMQSQILKDAEIARGVFEKEEKNF